ncbi:uncharacterized protein LOC112457895 [Temnothorax curvispinosus]|uniref:Uncharacterized protein LOC112457895 n=1 Tax=Temnothorax curvispinosus TaxID=300111 RepID=A0A6J1Q459_9HYME|nr:uncharacterized protein LOC112457895 [Temnothorax curvispinosus]
MTSLRRYIPNLRRACCLGNSLTETYMCDICQIVFEQKSKILRHITSKHSFYHPFSAQFAARQVRLSWQNEEQFKSTLHQVAHRRVQICLRIDGMGSQVPPQHL